MNKEQARKFYEVADRLSKLDVNTLSEQQLAERDAMIAQLQEVKQRLDPKCWTGKHKEGTKIKGGVRVNNCVPNESVEQGVAEAVWDRPSQSYVPRDGRTFGQTNHPREEHCDACGAATGHAGPGEDSNVDDEGNVYCDDCYASKQGVAEGSLNEFAPDGVNGGDDGEEFNPNLAKMAYDEGIVKGASLVDSATLERAMAINDWDKHDGGIYKQYFVKGFKKGRLDKINFNNKQYNLNLKLMKDGSIRHGEQGVAEGLEDSNIQTAIVDTVERLFRKNEISDYGALEAIRQGVKHHFSKPGATIESAVEGILNILDKRMRKSGNYVDLSRFKEALRQGVAHQLKKQGVAEQELDEKWSQKYKDSIDCNHPKGFSQKAHCAGKNESLEEANDEYDDEAGMAKSNLRTMSRAVNGLLDTIEDNDNLPEWAQEKLAKAEMMVTSVWDYLLSQKEQGIDPKVEESKKPSPKLTAVNIKKSDPVSEEINTEAYERLQKVFAFKNYES